MVTLVMLGQVPGMDLDVIENKDLSWLTGQTNQDLNRMIRTGIIRKHKKAFVIDDPDLILKFHQFLLENSKIAVKEADSQLIDGVPVRHQYLNDSKSVLFEKFLQTHEFRVSKSSLWKLMNTSKFKVFKMPKSQHIKHALCDKCSHFRLLKDSIYNSELSSHIDPKDLPEDTICPEKNLICYTNECFACSKENFKLTLLDKFEPDDPILDQPIEYGFIKADNSYDVATTTIREFLTINIPNMLYGFGLSGTKQKYINHLKRAEETEMYHKYVIERINDKNCVVAHMDYAMELTRDVARETQTQHFRKTGWPILGIIDYLPDKKKVYRYFIGEAGQSKSAEYTEQGLLQRNDRIKELIQNPNDITDCYIMNDGACNEFWSKQMMAYYPNIFMDLKSKFPNLKNLYVSKFAAGHGKGEIDSRHVFVLSS